MAAISQEVGRSGGGSCVRSFVPRQVAPCSEGDESNATDKDKDII